MNQQGKPNVIRVDGCVYYGNGVDEIKVYIDSEVIRLAVELPYVSRLINHTAVFRNDPSLSKWYLESLDIVLQEGDYAMMYVPPTNPSLYQFAHMCYFNGKTLINTNTNKPYNPYKPIKEGKK